MTDDSRPATDDGRQTLSWSGRRGSNPRPTAWKAVTLPLSYSRLRAHALTWFALRRAGPPHASKPCLGCATDHPSRRWPAKPKLASLNAEGWPANRSSLARPPSRFTLRWQPPPESRAEVGGEGRTRTFEAAGATDLQSAAFDRFATSPAVCVYWKRDVFDAYPDLLRSVDGAGEGI
jgi:hypothetical protein